jgi:hypothetical protein
MPVYRHRCSVCQARAEGYFARPDSPVPAHCGAPMERLMGAPFGRVAGSPAPPVPRTRTPLKQGRASRRFGGPAGEVVGQGRAPVQPQRQARPDIPGPEMPNRKWSKPYEACNAGERDERWRDTCEQMTAYRADCLTESGVDRGTALRAASEGQQATTADARAQANRG